MSFLQAGMNPMPGRSGTVLRDCHPIVLASSLRLAS